MPDDISDIIAQTLHAQGNTGTGAGELDRSVPASAVNTAPQGAKTPLEDGNTGSPAPAPVDDGPKVDWTQIKDPAALQLAKGLQAEYTKARQEAAELKRQIEEQNSRYAGVDEETLSSLQMLRTLQQEDPRLAQGYLRTLADRVGALGGAPQEPDAYGAYPPQQEWQDPSPYAYQQPEYGQDNYSGDDTLPPQVAARLQQLEQRAAVWERQQQYHEQQEANRRFREGLEKIEQTIGRAPTQKELLTVGRFLQDPRNQHLGVLDAYLVTHRDSYEQVILQRGRNEALASRQQAAGAPSAPALATPQAASSAPTDMKGIIGAAVREAFSSSA